MLTLSTRFQSQAILLVLIFVLTACQMIYMLKASKTSALNGIKSCVNKKKGEVLKIDMQLSITNTPAWM